jgi:hypothetical protein
MRVLYLGDDVPGQRKKEGEEVLRSSDSTLQ